MQSETRRRAGRPVTAAQYITNVLINGENRVTIDSGPSIHELGAPWCKISA